MKKRIISLALSAAMLFAGLSISAFAEEPLTVAEPAAGLQNFLWKRPYKGTDHASIATEAKVAVWKRWKR